MMEYLQQLDRQLFLFLNGIHSEWMDFVMWYVSFMWTWAPLYLVLLIVLYRRYPGKWFFLVIAMIALSITINDQLASNLFKNWIARLRPSHEPILEGMVHLVKEPNGQLYYGGLYSFYSSHAANFAGIITLFIFLMRPLKKPVVALLIAWLLLISYSRIYLGVHYPGDMLMGLVVGILVGWGCYRLFIFIRKKYGMQ